MTRSALFTVLLTFATVGGTATTASADDIRLKAAARLPFDIDAVRLGDIAELIGPESTALADVVIARIDRFDHPLEIPIRDVRARLDEAGVHWGRVNLSGRMAVVRPRQTPVAHRPLAMDTAILELGHFDVAEARAEVDDVTAETILSERTLRGLLARTLVDAFEVRAADLRLIFLREDRETLAVSESTYRLELQPLSSLRSERVKVQVRGWREGRIELEETVEFQPLLRTRTAVLTRDVRRNEAIDATGFEVQAGWFSPVQAELLCDPAHTVGHLALRGLKAGTVLRRQHARPANVVERGDRVTVRCLVGGVVITLQAEACDDGAKGDTIECRKLGERERFAAVVSGPGEAIVDLAR